MKEDTKIWLKTKEGQKFFIYKTEKCDMQKELTETINNLQSQLKAKEEELKYTVPIVEHNKIVSEKNKQNKQLEEVIKEAREYIETNTCWDLRTSKMLEILSKGENK